MTQGIYIVRHTPSRTVYIGQAVDVDKRLAEHRRALRGGYHDNPGLQQMWDTHHCGAINFDLIAEVEDFEDLVEQEQFHIDQYTTDCYTKWNVCNIANANRSTPPRSSTREKLSKALKGRVQPQSEIDARRARISIPVTLKDGRTFATRREFADACGYTNGLGWADIDKLKTGVLTHDDIAERRGLFGQDEQEAYFRKNPQGRGNSNAK